MAVKCEPKGFLEPELIRLLDAAHQRLRAPIVLIWDRLSLHRIPAIRSAIAARTAGELAAAVKNRLRRMRHRTRLVDGCLTGAGLSPPLPTRP
ncbi:hypothetical protein [Streptomyces sp. NPDC050355]|uniref:hypothetical protein n=1 Tax=Streptomyces sp. NPDC050355 TaxID=3365609 RepID=UPI0037B0D272